MTQPHRHHFQERMTILGDLEASSFLPWIRRHVERAVFVVYGDIEVAGPVELIDMMEMGCSLGPIDVWVETIERTPLAGSKG